MSLATWSSRPAPAPDSGPVRWWHSLRFRLAAAIAVLSAVLVLGFGALVVRQALVDDRERLRESAVVQVQQAAAVYRDTGTVPSHASLNDQWPPEVLVGALPGEGVASYDDGEHLWAARRLPTGELVSTRLAKTSLAKQQEDLRATVLRTAGLVTPLAWLLGWFAADALTSRLRATARQARTAGRDGGSPIYSGGEDEVAELARAIDDMAEALAERHASERAFSADVAHELRTPLTALVTAAELLPDGPDTDRVRGQVARLRTLMGDLLELARLDGVPPGDTVGTTDLGDAVAAALTELPRTLPVELRADASAVVRAQPAAVRRIVANLVANAHRHGRAPVTVQVHGPALLVSDAGPGFSAEFLERGPQRFHRVGNRPGSGLGLAIVVRHASLVGATVRLRNTTSGACAEVVFVEAST
ncbi:sensor histidine kinase [Isoptericola croceus]|uniref:sensor histidine kinase n=1 Tax=Isoptericola croceus TaxID=3031406 RepID=UPI0023F8FCC1|nr:HAMP domain-containing sensor histidine kinase [Isoptericola croceus]